LAEYAVANPNFVGRIPEGLSDEQAAPILCAGVTTYKGLKESGVRPGQYIAITGAAGGLGHVAVQYAKAMGMIVIAIDGGDAKMKFLKKLGADHVIDFTVTKDVPAEIKRICGSFDGPHGALMLAAVAPLFTQAVKYVRPRGTVVCIALPPGAFEVPVLDIILKAVNVKGSIVGTRLDLQEALEIAAAGKVKCNVVTKPITDINKILDDLHHCKIEGRVAIDFKRT
jgi:propanol-preferring alcohol dehydrogenase